MRALLGGTAQPVAVLTSSMPRPLAHPTRSESPRSHHPSSYRRLSTAQRYPHLRPSQWCHIITSRSSFAYPRVSPLPFRTSPWHLLLWSSCESSVHMVIKSPRRASSTSFRALLATGPLFAPLRRPRHPMVALS